LILIRDFTTIHVNIQEGVLSNKNSNQHGKHLFNQKKGKKKTPTTNESNSNSTNLSNSNISSSHETKAQEKEKDKVEKTEELSTSIKIKDRLSFITSEKSMELQNESNQFMKGNIANCYIFMSPAQRQKLISTPIRRKWTVNKNVTRKNNDVMSERCLVKDTFMTKSAQDFTSINTKNSDKNKGTHLYRQGALLSELKLFGSKKQYNPKFTLKSHLDGVRSLQLSNDRLTLISASEDNTLKLWDIKDFEKNPETSLIEPFLTLRDHKGPIFSTAARDDWNSESKIPFNSLFSAGSEVLFIIIIF